MECALNWFTIELLHECMLDIFVDPYVQIIPNWSENLHDTQMQHILNNYYYNFSWTCVGGCKIHVGGAQLWHRYLKLQSYPKNHKKIVSRFVCWDQ